MGKVPFCFHWGLVRTRLKQTHLFDCVYLILVFSAKLDGTTDKVKSKLAQHTSIEDWLELGDNYNKPVQVGKKRVRD